MSLIQAKEEALIAIQKTRDKLSLRSEDAIKIVNRDMISDKSSVSQQAPVLELGGPKELNENNLLPIDQDPLLEYQRSGECR